MKILIIGYGKMGKVVEKSALDRGWHISAIVDQQKDWDKISDQLDVDVAIEFSEPQSVFTNIDRCFDLGIPVVTGTTGWYDKMDELIRMTREKHGTLLYAPNFSKGVNILFAMNRWLSKQLEAHPGYKVQLTEYHHQHKLDAPSGTAIKLASDILAYHSAYTAWGKGPEAGAGEIPVISVRNGEIPGTHCILWESPDDSLRIIHEAKSRRMFAEGALDAAAWIINKKGIYSFEQMLFPE